MTQHPQVDPGRAELSRLPFFHETPAPKALVLPAGVTAHLTGTPTGSPPPPTPEEHRGPEMEPGLDEAGFWAAVAQLRRQAVGIYTSSIDASFTEAEKEALGRAVIAEVVRERAEEQLRTGGERGVWPEAEQQRMRQAIFNQMFRLGRYQELLDDPEVENIHIHGCDQVFAALTGGRMVRKPPVATSDEQLMADLQFFASRTGEEARPFSSVHPDLDMDLLGYVRLAAIAQPIAERPSAVLRIHRYINISLEQLVELGMLTPAAAAFLTVAVAAKRSIVISGFGGDGKTTLMRALAAKIGPWEQIVTVEKERELHLKNLANRIVPPFALQYRPGTGERDAQGNSPGEYSLERCMEKALRLNAERIMVGEVRGAEIVSMIQAMQVGAGTFCTTHAYNPQDCVDRLAGLGIGRYGAEYMKAQLGHHLDFIVQLAKVPQPDGRLVRKVTHITEVQPGEGTREVATTDLFRLDPGDPHARFLRLPTTPQLLETLVRAGLDVDAFTALTGSGGHR